MIRRIAAAALRPLRPEVFVVYDLGGAGRVLGVFTSRERAERLRAINPGYYKLTACALDRITAAGLAWADDRLRTRLEEAVR